MKFTKYFLTSILTSTCILPSVILTSCKPFVVDEEIKAHDELGWKHAIEHIANCGHPTIFLNTDASFYVQQEINMFLTASQLAIQNNHTYKNKGYEYNDMIMLVNNNMWNAKENKQGEKPGYFPYKFSTCIDENLGYSDIMANSKKAGNKIDLSLGNQMVISNLQDFDLGLQQYDKTRDDYQSFWTLEGGMDWWIGNVRVLNKIIDMYEAIDPNIKLNFVILDFLLDTEFIAKAGSSEIFSYNSELSKLQLRMFRHLDKLYVLSDGSYTYNEAYPHYLNYFKNYGYTSAKDQDKILYYLKTLPFDDALEYYKYVHPFVFYNNEKYVIHFQANTKSYKSPRVLSPKSHLTEETTCKYAPALFVPKSYKEILTNDTLFNNYQTSYLKFFNAFIDGKIPKFSNFVLDNTYVNFDSSKKNLIFFLPSSLTESQNPSVELFDECKSIMSKIRNNYPADKWNFMFSFHPRSKLSDIYYILNHLFDTTGPSQWPKNTVLLSNAYPFEVLLVLDQQLVASGTETHYHLIDPTTFDQDKPSGVMTSFDMLTTCFFSGVSLLSSELGVSKENAQKVIQKDAFYVTKKFDILNYNNPDGKDYSSINFKYLKNMYDVLTDVGEYPDVSKFSVNE